MPHVNCNYLSRLCLFDVRAVSRRGGRRGGRALGASHPGGVRAVHSPAADAAAGGQAIGQGPGGRP